MNTSLNIHRLGKTTSDTGERLANGCRLVLLGTAVMTILTVGSVVMLIVAMVTLFRSRRFYREVMLKWIGRAVLRACGIRLIVHMDEPLPEKQTVYISGNSGFVVGERGFGPATALDTVDAPILKPSAFGRGWDLGACVNGGVEGRAGDAPLPPKWLITMGLRQKNRFNECKACGCEPASNHMSGFGFSATDSDSGRRAHGSHERARSARKGRKKHVSVLPRPNRSPWIVVEQNHNGIGKLMVPAFQIYANMNVINDL